MHVDHDLQSTASRVLSCHTRLTRTQSSISHISCKQGQVPWELMAQSAWDGDHDTELNVTLAGCPVQQPRAASAQDPDRTPH